MRLKSTLDAYQIPPIDPHDIEVLINALPKRQIQLERNKRKQLWSITKHVLVRHTLILMVPLTLMLTMLSFTINEQTSNVFLQFCGLSIALLYLYGSIRADLYHMNDLEDTCCVTTAHVQFYLSCAMTLCSVFLSLFIGAIQMKLYAFPMILCTALLPYLITCLSARWLQAYTSKQTAYLFAFLLGGMSSCFYLFPTKPWMLYGGCSFLFLMWMISMIVAAKQLKGGLLRWN